MYVGSWHYLILLKDILYNLSDSTLSFSVCVIFLENTTNQLFLVEGPFCIHALLFFLSTDPEHLGGWRGGY
jgi:hypothetical protein